MKDLERRTLDISFHVEHRDDRPPKIVGHAALFDTLSGDLGGFREQIKQGAFVEAIENDDVRALWNHDPNFVLGRNKAKTLRLKEDSKGLAIEIDPPDTQFARDLLTSMERGDVSQMSFAFSVRQGGADWSKDDEGMNIRTLTNVRLFDVSPVTYPAYTQTEVAVRSMKEWEKESAPAPDYSIQRKRLDLMEEE